MSISSIGSGVNSIAHAVSNLAESVAPQTTSHPETTVNPQSPSTVSSSMASFVPAGGLHAVAGDQPTATAKESEGRGFSGIVHDVLNGGGGGGGTGGSLGGTHGLVQQLGNMVETMLADQARRS